MQAAGGGDGAGRDLTETPSAREVIATAKGMGFFAGGTAVEFLTRFVIVIIMARALGPHDYGIYILAVSAAGLFAGVSLLGLDDAMVRYIAIQAGRRDDAGIWGTLQIGIGTSALAGLLMGGALFVAAQPIALGLFHAPTLTPLLRLLAPIVPFLTMSSVFVGVARGFGRMDYAVYGEKGAQSIVRLLLIVLLALLGHLNLVAAIVVFGISDVAASVTLVVLLNRVFPFRRSLRSNVRRDVKELFGFALPLWLSGMLRQFRRNIQNIMLGAVDTVSTVGVFSVVSRVNLVSTISSQSIYTSVRPFLARLHDRKERDRLTGLYRTSTRWMFALYLPFFLVMVLYPRPLLMVFGKSFTSGATALIVLAFAQLANAATGICQAMIDMTGHTRVKLANSVLFTVLLIGGGALLIPRWGVMGAAIVSLIAIGSVNILSVVEVWFFERMSPFDRAFLKPVGAGIGALLVGFTLDWLRPVGTALLPTAVQATIVCSVYGGLVLLFGLAPDDRLVVGRTARKVGLSRVLVRSRSA